MRNYKVMIEKDEDGFFVASVPGLPGCFTQAKSMDTLMKRIKEAIELYLEPEKVSIEPKHFFAQAKVVGGHGRPSPS